MAELSNRQRIDLWKKHCTTDEKGRQIMTVGGFVDALIEALRSAEREGWVSVSERLPPHTGCVLAHYLNKLGKHRTVRAFYAPRFTVEDTSDAGMDDAEVKDDDSTSYIAEGWYEECDQAEYYYRISETVTHWQHLPAAPRTDGETR
jgi:hypothetical protein